MPHHSSFWHSVGRTLGSAIPGSDGKSHGRGSNARYLELAGAAMGLLATVRRGRGKKLRLGRIVKGAAAGAGAAGLLFALRTIVPRRDPATDDDGDPDDRSEPEFADELMAGAGRGIVYAAILAPVLPGPPVLRGLVAGGLDYLIEPLGGLFSHLQSLSPIRRVPVISILLETGDAEDDPLVIFLVNGALLGILYGAPRHSA